MNFLRRLLGTNVPSPMERLRTTESGSIIDTFRSNSPIWLVRSDTMKSIANGMSERLGPDVLRTLRYAARDEWAMMLSESNITWKGIDPSSWRGFDRLWKGDGHLHASMIMDGEVTRYVVESTSLASFAAGSFSAALEHALQNNIRVGVESQNEGAAFLSVEMLEQSELGPHLLNRRNPSNERMPGNMLEIDEIEIDKEGVLTLFNAPLSIVPLRLFTFWERSSSHLLPIDGEESSKEWSEHLGNSVAKAFIDSGEMIMIEDEGSWAEVGKNQISKWGLGILDSVSLMENTLRIRLRSDAQYCIPRGILTACLQRATAKKITPKESRSDSGFELLFDLNR